MVLQHFRIVKMNNFIKDFYYGNVDPQARAFKKNSVTKKALDSINDIEEKLTKSLTDDEKKLFLDFVNANSELLGESTLDSFILGFRLGAKFTYDTFISDEAPYYNY